MSHKRFPFLFLSTLLSLTALAQDTLHVQTLTFDSITTRRGWWAFPDATHEYRKVLIHHTLKCDPQTTWDQYNCGEWDYLTYNMVHQHTGLLDSTAHISPHFLVGNSAPAQVERLSYPIFDTIQRVTHTLNVLQVNSFTEHTSGTGSFGDGTTFNGSFTNNRNQFLFTAGELASSGVELVPITQLRFDVDQASVIGIDRVIIRVKLTSAAALNGFDDAALTTVYDAPFTFASVGANTITLTTPFVWDGVSNLVVDIACGSQVQNSVVVAADPVPATSEVRTLAWDRCVRLRNDFIGLTPSLLASVDSAITITCWVFGDANLPQNTSVLEGVDAQGRRLLNVHLPWSDSRVYWDAGNDGTGYDRIDKAATTAQIQGQWNHWAFVKNCVTGSMKIYLNGVLWHSGNGKTKLMSGITSFRIGSSSDGSNPFPGLVDGFHIFNKELGAATISAWMNRRVTGTHPDHANLVAQFEFDEDADATTFINDIDNTVGAWPLGTVQRVDIPATARHIINGSLTQVRPTITFVHAQLSTAANSLIEHALAVKPMLTQQYFEVAGNGIVPYDTLTSWGSTEQYTIGPDSAVLDSTYAAGTVEVNGQLTWYGVPFEVVKDYEIGRYITPYGIGLSLGTQGFRWTYDITDYQWLLHDSVELSAGNTQELIDLEFELIEGTPTRPVVNHQRPWGGLNSYSYANLDNDVSLPSVVVNTDPAASQWSLRTRFTGHGHNSNDGNYPHCCEWKDNTHFAYANGSQIDAWHIWLENDCALNPVYPQGGTWLGSREGWCPGDLVKDHSIEITPYVSGGQVALDYDITPVPTNNQGMGGGNYVVNMDLFEYGSCAQALDAEVYLVKRPTDAGYYRRDNPICTPPLVTLRNSGSTTLTSVVFSYRVSGGVTETYAWNGSLPVAQTEDVELPIGSGWFWQGDASNLFTVTVSAPNGGTDGYAENDSYTSHFELPEVFAENFVLNYKTNNRPWENSLTISDIWGNVVFSRNNHTANTVYNDTLHLATGCYEFEFLDSGNDGLSYWADTQQGSGYFRWRSQTGSLLENFGSEFGRKLHKAFVLGDIVGMAEQPIAAALQVFPNPAHEQLTLVVSGLDDVQQLRIIDMNGRVVRNEQWNTAIAVRRTLDLRDAAPGLYVITLSSPKGTLQQRVIIE